MERPHLKPIEGVQLDDIELRPYEADGRVWGVTAYRGHAEIGSLLLFSDHTISRIWVHKQYRRHGLATAMYRKLIDEYGIVAKHDWDNINLPGLAWARSVSPLEVAEYERSYVPEPTISREQIVFEPLD